MGGKRSFPPLKHNAMSDYFCDCCGLYNFSLRPSSKVAYLAILEGSGLCAHDIAKSLGSTMQGARYHVEHLRECGLIFGLPCERNGRIIRYYPETSTKTYEWHHAQLH